MAATSATPTMPMINNFPRFHMVFRLHWMFLAACEARRIGQV